MPDLFPIIFCFYAFNVKKQVSLTLLIEKTKMIAREASLSPAWRPTDGVRVSRIPCVQPYFTPDSVHSHLQPSYPIRHPATPDALCADQTFKSNNLP